MDKYLYSDLACESYSKSESIQKILKKLGGLNTEEYIVFKNEGALKKGRYVTVYTERMWGISSEEFSNIKKVVSHYLHQYLCQIHFQKIGYNDSFMVVGLGNPILTPDSLGAKVVKNIFVTSHLPLDIRKRINKPRVCAITPDVTGNTGIETRDAISAIINQTNPSVLIIIDSLASRGLDRLAKTVQISDVGLIPGSGIGEARAPIDNGRIHVPIISIGIPTVIRLSTAIYDVCSKFGDKVDRSVLDSAEDFFVCPKDIDRIVDSSALIVADAINDTLICNI